MVKIFGKKLENITYQSRQGVYAIIINSTKDKILTVKTSRGDYFLPGGGIENTETYQECLEREILEETGYTALIGNFIGNAKSYFLSTKKEPLLNDGYFYLAELLEKSQEPIEVDHFVQWIELDKIELLVHEHHRWAVREGMKI